jgi:hypothetical protein
MHRTLRYSGGNMICLQKKLHRAALLMLLALAAAPAAAGDVSAQQAALVRERPAVAVEKSPYGDATIYSFTEGNCTIRLYAYTTELNRGVVKHWAACPAPLVRQLPFLTAVFGEFLAKDRFASSFRTLFWGGLVPEQGRSSFDMPLRLALAAHRSPAWDRRRGRPLQGDMNKFVKDLANAEPIYPELGTLFGRFHRSISIASVEKVRVLKAEALPFYEALKKEGVQAKDKLPFDCMVWFTVTGEKP